MNSAWTTLGRIIVLSTVAAGLVGAGPTLAQTGTTPQTPAAAPKTASSKPGDGSPQVGPRIQVRILKAEKLRKMMQEKVELTSEQKTKIGHLFEGYIEDTKNSAPMRANAPNRPPNKVIPPEMPELQKELQKAQEAGNDAAVERLRREIESRKREPTSPADDHSDTLVEKVRAELTAEQVPAFEAVVARWKAISPRGFGSGPVQQLRRALLDPDAGLTADDQAMADKVLQDTLKSIQSDPNHSPERTAEAVDKARITIYEKLTPSQRNKVEANLKTFKAEEKELENAVKRVPKRVDNTKKKDAKGAAAPESPDKKDSDKPDKDGDED